MAEAVWMIARRINMEKRRVTFFYKEHGLRALCSSPLD
jgi:hypothetical protein